MTQQVLEPYINDLDDDGLKCALDQLECNNQGSAIYYIDQRLGTYWHNYMYDVHIKNLEGGLLNPESRVTKSAINIFVELAAHWVTPNHERRVSGGGKISASEAAHDPRRKVPGWVKEAFTIYQKHYDAMRAAARAGSTPPEFTFETADLIAHDALRLLKERLNENKYDFEAARQQTREMQQARRSTRTAQPTPTPAPPTVAPLLTNPFFNPAVPATGYQRCPAGSKSEVRRRF